MANPKRSDGLVTLTRDQLIDMLDEMADVRSVELKMTVPADQRMSLYRLGFDPLEGMIRLVYFFDTPDLTLFRNGLVLRARRTQHADDDTVVKLRPIKPSELPQNVRTSKNLKIEMDVSRGTYVVSASLKGTRSAGAVAKTMAGERSLERLFTKEQRDLFADRTPGVGWDELMPLGPIFIVLLKWAPPGFRRTTIEQWHYPGEVPLVEISTKATPKNAVKVAAESMRFLRDHGLSAAGTQEPKTRKALEFFAPRRGGSRSGRRG
jgi:hypothetical protein